MPVSLEFVTWEIEITYLMCDWNTMLNNKEIILLQIRFREWNKTNSNASIFHFSNHFWVPQYAIQHDHQMQQNSEILQNFELLTACLTVRGKPSRIKPDSPFSSPLSRRFDNKFTMISSETKFPWFTISASCRRCEKKMMMYQTVGGNTYSNVYDTKRKWTTRQC